MNSKPPEDDQSFLIMQQIHIKEKKDLYKNLELEKRLDKTKTIEELNSKNKSLVNDNEKNFYDEDSSMVNSSSLSSSRFSKDNRAKTFQKNANEIPNKIKGDEIIIPKNLKGYRKSNSKIDENSKLKKYFFSENEPIKNSISVSNYKSEKINSEESGNNNLVIQNKNSFDYQIFYDDKDSLFHPENTKNKKNLNESENLNLELKEKSDLLILRENNNENVFKPMEKISNLSSLIVKKSKTDKLNVSLNKNEFSNDKKLEKSEHESIKNYESPKNSYNSNFTKVFPNIKKTLRMLNQRVKMGMFSHLSSILFLKIPSKLVEILSLLRY